MSGYDSSEADEVGCVENKVVSKLSDVETSGTLRRGRRPRTRPKSYVDFVEVSCKKNAHEIRKTITSSESESEDGQSKQKATSLFTNDDVEGQDIFKFKSRHTKLGLQNKVNSALNSPKTPLALTPKTPRNKRLSLMNTEAETPKHVKEMMKKRIISAVQSDSDSDFSGSSSDFVPEKSEEESSTSSESECEVAPAPVSGLRMKLRRTDGRNRLKRDTDYVVTPDSYFMMNSGKKITTSDHTLERLKNYNPSDAPTDTDNLSDEHKTRFASLNTAHQQLFDRWLYALSENYSVLLYGVGSKRSLLQTFQATKLKDFPCVVVNGFFPSLTIRNVLESILNDLLEISQVPSNVREAVNVIEKELKEQGMHLFLIVHNIDGVMLQNNKAQTILANLSHIPNVHMIASIDHINAPLIWDHTKLSRFSFTWWDVTTFCPYVAETSFESADPRGARVLQLSSLVSVHRSLTDNARRVFRLIAESQLSCKKQAHYQGLSFRDLYSKSREQFLVSSDLALRAQLTEFLDHKLVVVKRAGDGENLVIPIDNALLQQFMDNVEG